MEIHETGQDESASLPSEEECWALVERVAASNHFKRSARLREFLLYVGRQSLRHGGAELNEQEIGANVFGRPVTYDRSQDNIVRVNASELRKRIDLYFSTEGVGETLLLEIPRGGYRPVFHRRSAVASHEEPQVFAVAASVSAEPAAASRAQQQSGWNQVWWGAATLLLVLACGVLLQQNRALRKLASPWDQKPAVAEFWRGFLQNHQQTDVVLPDDSVSVIEDVMHRPVSLEDYLNRDYMRQVQSSDLSAERKMDLDQIFAHNLITFGGVRAAQMMLAQIPTVPLPHLTLSRYYTADAMKRNNVILIGGRKANPWVHLFDDRMNFVTDFDHVQGRAFISNAHPKPGEPAMYTAPLYPNALTGYSVVAYLPNPSRSGNAIILAGMDSDATSAAAEFLTSEPQLEHFRTMLQVKQFPYFEAVLKISRVSGTSFNAEIVAYRTYP